MAPLPGIDSFKPYLSQTQYRSFIAVHYCTILLYTCVFALTLVNIWQIIIKQGKWRTIPLLFFYIFSFISVLCRILAMIWDWTLALWVLVVDATQPIAKVGVGLIQSWMVLELAIRIRHSINTREDKISDQLLDQWIRTGQIAVVAISILYYSLILIFSITTACEVPEDQYSARFPFCDNPELEENMKAFSFLTMFLIMAIVNLALWLAISARNKLYADRTSEDFKREQCILITVFVFFETSYGVRFLWDKYAVSLIQENPFLYCMLFEIPAFLDGLSYLSLLLCHYYNFKNDDSVENPSESEASQLYLQNPTPLMRSLTNGSIQTKDKSKEQDQDILSHSFLTRQWMSKRRNSTTKLTHSEQGRQFAQIIQQECDLLEQNRSYQHLSRGTLVVKSGKSSLGSQGVICQESVRDSSIYRQNSE